MVTTRTHITTRNLGRVLPESKPQQIEAKPEGFWYGVDGDWERWCRAESYGLSAKDPNREYALMLKNENILYINKLAEFDRFEEEYRISSYLTLAMIDWPRVAEKYDGIEIAPYFWEKRLASGSFWYYGWDCASGCIWRPKGVTLTYVGDVKL